MSIYVIRYSSYEDSTAVYLEHEKQFTAEEFREAIIKAVVGYMKALKSSGNKQIVPGELIDGPCALSPANIHRLFGGSTKWPCIMTTADIFPYIGTWLENYGFKIVRPSQEVCFWGWRDPFADKDWENETGDDDTALLKALREAGFTEDDSASKGG